MFGFSLRKHAYSNILKILQPKKEHFQIINSDIFHISVQNIDCGYSLEPPDQDLHCLLLIQQCFGTSTSGVARRELFLRTPRKKLEIYAFRNASKIGATLKGKNLLPEGANSFL